MRRATIFINIYTIWIIVYYFKFNSKSCKYFSAILYVAPFAVSITTLNPLGNLSLIDFQKFEL